MTPNPTDTELDELEVDVDEWRVGVGLLRKHCMALIKALRACRARSKAKEAVVEAARTFLKEGTKLTYVEDIAQVVIERPDKSDPQCKLSNALAALDKTDD